jgi:phage terminase large subunit-like protein
MMWVNNVPVKVFHTERITVRNRTRVVYFVLPRKDTPITRVWASQDTVKVKCIVM